MSFEKGDSVVLHDEHSEHDGEVGQVTQVTETMFGDENYTVSFEDGQEAGIPAESLEVADEDEAEAEAGTEDAEE
jgi:predicted N-acetyltransferase YhbS